MKEIPNKQFDEHVTTVSLLTLSLNCPPRAGFDLVVMRARNRVADAIEKIEVGGIINLEDNDYSTAQTAIRECRWTNRDKFVPQFADQFGC